jgi:hypothetical protein
VIFARVTTLEHHAAIKWSPFSSSSSHISTSTSSGSTSTSQGIQAGSTTSTNNAAADNTFIKTAYDAAAELRQPFEASFEGGKEALDAALAIRASFSFQAYIASNTPAVKVKPVVEPKDALYPQNHARFNSLGPVVQCPPGTSGASKAYSPPTPQPHPYQHPDYVIKGPFFFAPLSHTLRFASRVWQRRRREAGLQQPLEKRRYRIIIVIVAAAAWAVRGAFHWVTQRVSEYFFIAVRQAVWHLVNGKRN